MFAPSIHVECVSFFEPTKGEWREERVKGLAEEESSPCPDDDDEDFLSFCRRSLL
ncbi:MAG: hypothetical protein B193_0310 [Solidesulfovibrio magneticus str. Maddingley MBC34]|uniref:Uncharacterized protein n=1 Tax=Solidesulfovibrio magneticus str. Maddingley MBC34 TaxID=1206767 RepID=K6GIM7_9BACT|nr:MAG: hypothetical protein B193_0310 [Solidesulfovibrio magneticus str. Maddingley MBC34]